MSRQQEEKATLGAGRTSEISKLASSEKKDTLPNTATPYGSVEVIFIQTTTEAIWEDSFPAAVETTAYMRCQDCVTTTKYSGKCGVEPG